MWKYKTIKEKGKVFLRRLSYYLKDGRSIKLHFITNDDTGLPHSHPWNFKSFLIIPYKENLYIGQGVFIKLHKPFTTVKRKAKMLHRVSLYRVLGIKIPALTIGIYSEKKQLCSLCTELGYCKTNKK